jgi:hypothetical protein
MVASFHQQKFIAQIASLAFTLLMVSACTTSGGGGVVGNCVVVSIALTPNTTSGLIGGTIQFTATALDQQGNVCGAATLNWTTNNAAIMSINSNGLARMLFSGKTSDYPASIIVTATDSKSGISRGAIVTVSNPVAAVVITSSTPPTLTICQSFQFAAEARDSLNTPLSSVPVSWTSSNLSVTTMSDTGVSTATGDGGADITATAYGVVSSPSTLSVSGGSPIIITVSPLASTIPAGSSGLMAATVSGFVSDNSVTWSVDGGDSNGTVVPQGPLNATYHTPFTYVGFPAATPIAVRATSNENPACSSTASANMIPTFHAATQYGAGGLGNAQALAVGRFSSNIDNNLDIAVVNQNGLGLSVWRGDGTGRLQLSSTMLTGGTDVAITQGFFDPGILPDLAVLNLYGNYVHTLLGTGLGTFTLANPPTTPLYGPQMKSLVAGDFDLDGDDDLAVTDFSTIWPGVTLLRNDGNGVFTDIGTRVLFWNPFIVRKGLINNDNLVDLVVSNFTGDKIQFMMGDGTINFGPNPEVILPAGTGPADIAVADFDGGFADLAVVNRGQLGDTCPPPANPEADKVTILLGHGDFTFDPPTTVAVGSNPRAIASGDFNKDGYTDLVVANFCDDTISVLFGNGDGTFQPAINYPLGQPGLDRPTDVAVGDLNNDSFDDIIVTNSGTDSIAILLNNN